jgi:hypothetical protein
MTKLYLVRSSELGAELKITTNWYDEASQSEIDAAASEQMRLDAAAWHVVTTELMQTERHFGVDYNSTRKPERAWKVTIYGKPHTYYYGATGCDALQSAGLLKTTKCPTCNGTGAVPFYDVDDAHGPILCKACKGTGLLEEVTP